ncbi:MAG: bifunctional DNA-formamidopyrimidine glycosylase/DNA-(apurinic or apyrimidinic site) lyase [Pseudomonadota bacterium]
MPELPEVETVRRGLAPVVEGQRVIAVQVNRPDLRWPMPPDLAARLTRARIQTLSRRSKYLLAALDTDETLIVHLGMSGRMLVSGDPLGQFVHDHPAKEKHDHVVIDLENGARVTFNDPRRFGMIDLSPTAHVQSHWLLGHLGPEPNGNAFSGAYLAERFAGKRTPVKAALLDQRIVAGLGNIYVCEALFRAGISPKRHAGRISKARLESLASHARDVIGEAIQAGGSSLRDFRQTDGELGYFQHNFAVYDREGAPCPKPRCDGEIRRIVQSGRSSFYCCQCQR